MITYKNITEVEVVNEIPNGATTLINDNDELKQMPLSVLDYNNLTNAEVMEEVSENSMALVNEGGVIKQVPCGAGFGGGSGIATAIIKGNKYMNSLNAVASVSEDPEEFICFNMTFEEARDIILSGEPLMAVIMMKNSYGYGIHPVPCVNNELNNGTPCIYLCGTIVLDTYYDDHIIITEQSQINLYWTASGISDWNPNAPA